MSTTALAAEVHLHAAHTAGPIDERIFGGFLEHLGRAVYEGVYDPGNPNGLADEQGFRTDVLDALKPLAMPVVRYPGGNFVSAYDWRDGIGPKDRRPTRPDFAWKSLETNQFGTDEFLAWCKAAGTAPMMAVNLGTDGPRQAAEWVEYCNLGVKTSLTQQRADNGHPDPYGVKLWCLGNEMDGPWQAGHVPAEVYAQRAQAASALMRGIDETIETIICGSSGRGMPTYLDWDRVCLEYCWDHVDYVSAHRYSSNAKGDTPAFLAEGVDIDRHIAEYAGLLDYVRGKRKSDKRVYLSFDEWNVWYRTLGENDGEGRWTAAPPLLEEVYNLEDAVVVAQYLSAFIRRADVVKVACIAQAVNVIAPILTRPDGLVLQTIYHPLRMYRDACRGASLRPAVSCATYAAGHRGTTPVLDAAASHDATANGGAGEVAVYLVNRSTDREVTADVSLAGAGSIDRVVSAEELGGGDVKAANTFDAPDAVTPRPGRAEVVGGRLRVTVPSPGVAVVRASLK